MEINEALQAISRRNEAAISEQRESVRGEQGPKGDRGPAGTDGRPGADARIEVGKITSGDVASARIRFENGIHYLDLILPTGPVGPRGAQGLPSQVPGPAGAAGAMVSREEIKRIVQEVVSENAERFRGFSPTHDEIKGVVFEVLKQNPKFRGPQGERGLPGESIVGPQGAAGDSLDEKELQKIFLKVLGDAGLISAQQAKLIQVHAELRKAINHVSARSIFELQEVFKKVDAILTD